MSIRPIGKRVLVREEKAEEKRASGLIIPGNSEDKSIKYARVEAVGSGIEEVAKGEKIIFSRGSGKEIEDGGVKYILLEIEEVLAAAEEER